MERWYSLSKIESLFTKKRTRDGEREEERQRERERERGRGIERTRQQFIFKSGLLLSGEGEGGEERGRTRGKICHSATTSEARTSLCQLDLTSSSVRQSKEKQRRR